MKNIPKICHLTWNKGSNLSFLHFLTILSFHKYNPDWQIIVHLVKQKNSELGTNIYTVEYLTKDYFQFIDKLGYVIVHEVDLVKENIQYQDKTSFQISDILRCKYLYEQGGVYSDFDTLWLQPIENFRNVKHIGNIDDFEMNVSYFHLTHGYHNNANFIAEPGSLLLGRLLQEQSKLKHPYTHQAFNNDLCNNLFPTLESLLKEYPRVLAVEYQTFNPFLSEKLKDLYQKDDTTRINSKVMAVHWFNGHKLSQEYLVNRQRCSMTSILKKEGYM